jgi:threonine-phosphate decarboxylase
MQNVEQNAQQDLELRSSGEVITDKKIVRTTRVHGGNILDAVERYGIREKDIVDFSANANPLGPSSAALRAAKKALAVIGRYPDGEMNELRKAIARYFGIRPGHVVCGNGSTELIHLIPRVYKPKKVLVPVPTFTEYAAAAAAAGSEVINYPLKEKDGFRVDPIEMAFALKGVDMIFLCNPNNPTGLLVPKGEMREILNYALKEGVRVVVDEAFMDFIDNESLVKDAVQSPHVICLRAFTKFYGMPGLRVGYAVANEETAASLASSLEPWSVSTPAERAAIAALNDWGYTKKTRKLIAKERDRLLSALRLLPGVEPFPSSVNFIFIKLASVDSRSLTQTLGLRGILIRDCSSFPNLNNRFVRIAVRTRRENERLLAALRDVLLRVDRKPNP